MKADIRNLDLNLLKTLDALLDERSVTRAATRLSLTQPMVSGMLTRLREAFNDPLFIRAPHGMVPTLRAQALASCGQTAADRCRSPAAARRFRTAQCRFHGLSPPPTMR